ncbi:uncharacterized protein LOC121379913 [Gigantopelta aegis]|uniref:uncharacterized protein LOC121379913 n=1 Tax=Gigantopelta aegis TaxID=1735272 RepID=UPI001B88971D|nr:uncharacterized protein LOC121379913 [Gigantopelta aegis]
MYELNEKKKYTRMDSNCYYYQVVKRDTGRVVYRHSVLFKSRRRCLRHALRHNLAQYRNEHTAVRIKVVMCSVNIVGERNTSWRTPFEMTLIAFYLHVLQPAINQMTKDSCEGCAIDHPSQTQHSCLMMTQNEAIDSYFQRALQSLPHEAIVRDAERFVRIHGEPTHAIHTLPYTSVEWLQENFLSENRRNVLEMMLRVQMTE